MKLEKTTKEPRRGYDDACGLAHALELIGERWALLVMRELMFGPRRFAGLRADLPGISANVLTQRLKELEQRGLVRRIKLPPPASVQVYEATEWGLEAAPLIRSLGRWAVRSPAHDPERQVSAVSIMMSMQTMFDAERATDFCAVIGVRFADSRFTAEVRDGRFDAWGGEAERPDFTFEGTPEQLGAVLYGGAPLESIDVGGDVQLARRFVSFFPLPPKVS